MVRLKLRARFGDGNVGPISIADRLREDEVSTASRDPTGEEGGLGRREASKGKDDGGRSSASKSSSAMSSSTFALPRWLRRGNDAGGGLLERMTMGADSALFVFLTSALFAAGRERGGEKGSG